jgi:hypothetical protein
MVCEVSRVAGGRYLGLSEKCDRRLLERFQAKWEPVRRPETRQIKNLEALTVSVKRWTPLTRE